jgi:hypothetical protein
LHEKAKVDTPMNAVNLQASVNNVTQMDKFQQDQARTPVVNQDQNAAIAREEAEKRIRMPTEPEHAEGKKIDPRQERKNRQSRKKRQNKNIQENTKGEPRSPSSGYIVDIQA